MGYKRDDAGSPAGPVATPPLEAPVVSATPTPHRFPSPEWGGPEWGGPSSLVGEQPAPFHTPVFGVCSQDPKFLPSCSPPPLGSAGLFPLRAHVCRMIQILPTGDWAALSPKYHFLPLEKFGKAISCEYFQIRS